MTATQGVITAGIALALGVGALVFVQTVWRERNAARAALILVGAILCVGGAVWFLLSLAAYGGAHSGKGAGTLAEGRQRARRRRDYQTEGSSTTPR
jgi:hypothetical protein